jgi:opine dehydrogenase
MVKAPPSLDHRYLHEDVGWGLVPWTALATTAGVRTPTMDALIHLAGVANEVDYPSLGLNLDRMGLADMAPQRMITYAWTGS